MFSGVYLSEENDLLVCGAKQFDGIYSLLGECSKAVNK
jgi:hypothetical protein